MAIDVSSEISSPGFSPRISFSHDLNKETDAASGHHQYHHRLDASLLDPDFDFCVGSSFVQEVCSADELFFNGKILPTEIKKNSISAATQHQKSKPLTFSPLQQQPKKPLQQQPKKPLQQQQQPSPETSEKKQLKEFLLMSVDQDEEKSTKSFWQFKRSNSLNIDSSRSKGLIRSLQFLSRSNSTGSAPNPPKQAMLSKEATQKQPQLRKQSSVPSRKSSSSSSSVSSSTAFYSYNSSQNKPPLLRKCGSYGNGVRISPVLNIPPPYISPGTVNLFGLGSLLCNGKVKKKKR